MGQQEVCIVLYGGLCFLFYELSTEGVRAEAVAVGSVLKLCWVLLRLIHAEELKLS